MCPPIVVLVVVLNSQEGVGEDVYEGHSDGRTQPAVRLELSIVNQTSSEAGCVWLGEDCASIKFKIK